MTVDYEAGEIPAETRGERLKRSLRYAGLQEQEMAAHLGCSARTVSRWCNDQVEPAAPALRVWALRCGVPYSWLMTGQVGGPATSGDVDTCRYPQLDTPENPRFLAPDVGTTWAEGGHYHAVDRAA